MRVRVVGCLLGLVLVVPRVGAAPLEVTVEALAIDASTGNPVVRLVEKTPPAGLARRELPIWVGPFEAQAIALEMHGVPAPRPFTHDLMKQLVERLGGRLVRVEVTELRDGTYFAVVHLAGADGREVVVDARPSDAIALALRLHGPILVAEELLGSSAATAGAPPAGRLWGLTLQDLTPEIAEFFAAPGARGVLVADVAAGATARDVQRGDVITALDGGPVGSLRELATRAGARAASEPVRLSLRRAGRVVEVRFSAD